MLRKSRSRAPRRNLGYWVRMPSAPFAIRWLAARSPIAAVWAVGWGVWSPPRSARQPSTLSKPPGLRFVTMCPE